MKGNQYALTVRCMLTNYVIYVPIPDKFVDTLVTAYQKKHIVDSEEVERNSQMMDVNSKIHYFQK